MMRGQCCDSVGLSINTLRRLEEVKQARGLHRNVLEQTPPCLFHTQVRIFRKDYLESYFVT